MLHQIGAGSLGPVFRGEDPARAEAVAIKSLQVDVPPERSRQVADQLAELAARLPVHHTVIAPVDAGLADLVPYVVWPLLEGTSLDVALREFGPAACMDALPRLAAVADALDRAAANGVWHGALHPRDVMVGEDDTWVIGLGIAPILERSGVRLPARRPYTAPEQLEGHATSPQADQFALAAIAHEWLFGRRVAGPANESLSIPQLPGVDRTRMTDAFSTGLALLPSDRYASAADFVRALERSVIDQHEAKIESMARAARRQARAAASAVPRLPLEEALAAGVFAPDDAEGDAEPARFRDIEDDDPLDRMIAGPSAPPETTFDAHEGLQISSELEPDELDAFPMSEADSDDNASRNGGDRVDDERATNGFIEEAPPERSAPALVTGGFRSLGDDGADTRHSSGGGYGVGTVIAALFVGLFLGTAAGYGLAMRQPPTAALLETEPMVTDTLSGQPSTEGTLSPASPPATPPPVSREAPAATTPVPAPVAAPVEERPGRLLVRSTPAGAQVRVDGELRGVTPLALRDLPLATHRIVVTGDGFQPAEHQVALTSDRPSRSLDVALARPAAPVPAPVPPVSRPTPARPAAAATGSMLVESRPAGAEVRIDDRQVGTTPVTVPALAPGAYRVTIARDGYQAWTTTVRVVAGERARVAASLVGGRFEE